MSQKAVEAATAALLVNCATPQVVEEYKPSTSKLQQVSPHESLPFDDQPVEMKEQHQLEQPVKPTGTGIV